MLFPIPVVKPSALNEIGAPFGLSVSPSQAALLRRQEETALAHIGRICFGESILPQLAAAFAASPYIQRADWADTLGDMTGLFYTLKSETKDRLSDEELIARMSRTFNGPARGDLLQMADLLMEAADASDPDSGYEGEPEEDEE